MADLPEELYNKISLLCKKGDELVQLNELEAAKDMYISALKLLPDNINDWEAATWIYVAIGDVNFRMKSYDKCFNCFFNAVQCPKGLGNPFIHLRLGQMYFEQGQFDKAADELTRSYMGAGIEIFYEDDPKYLEFLETKITL